MGTNVLAELTTDLIEQRLIELESLKARICAQQIMLLRETDRRQVPLADGCRSLGEWTAARLDITPDTARELVAAGRLLADRPEFEVSLSEGDGSFDRILATVRLAAAGAPQSTIERSTGFDICGIQRLTAQQQRITPTDQRQTFTERYVAMQPSLDRTSFRLWGQLPGTDGELVEQALLIRGDQFPCLPDGSRGSLGQRHADALVSISQDSLTTTTSGDTLAAGPVLSVFTNGELAAVSEGEAGSATSSGISVGVSTIEEILCGGSVEHSVITEGQPLAVGQTTRVISPRLRRYVLYRDGDCTADGCTSRYRLQPHHRLPWSQGGRTDPDNLTTLCWFHHHVVIHQMGYTIKPDTPPQRLRFNPPGHHPP